jgi:tetratricopeptide (TPR) repeat protein
MPRKRDNIDREERKEEALRPSPYIGYNRDKLAIYLLSRKAYKIAESQFRRAIWLNPYEPVFKQHLAVCLYQDGRYTEAKEWILKALEQKPDDTENHKILELIEQELSRK